MGETHVFKSNTKGSVKNLFSKNSIIDTLYIKVEDDRISGKGYICNQDGKNEFFDEFSFGIADVKNVFMGEFMKTDAVGIDARLVNLYGAKNVRIFLPNLQNMNLVVSLINRLRNKEADLKEVPVKEQAPTEPRPATQPSRPAPQPVEKTEPKKVEVTPVVNQQDDDDASSRELQEKMEKLSILMDCGLLGEKEYNAKKIELVSQYCDLAEFNEKIQKLVVLKDCELLSEKEFEANKIDIIKECCNMDVTDMKEYRRNLQKMSFLEMGGVITAEELEKSKKVLVDEVKFSISDTNEEFARKLKKLPILKECDLITEKEYRQKLEYIYSMISIEDSKDPSELPDKLSKWCVLAEEGFISEDELKKKQAALTDGFVNDWQDVDGLRDAIKKMLILKRGKWLSETDYLYEKEDILKKIAGFDDSIERLKFYEMMCEEGFVDEAEYQKQKQQMVDDIFKPHASMAEFKEKVNRLMEYEKNGVISEAEFAEYKEKLMSEL